MKEGWEEKKLKEIAKYRRGSFPQPYGNKDWYDGEGSMPFVQVAELQEDSFRMVPITKKRISKIAQPLSVFVPAGTVIVSLQGSIGKVAITDYDSYVDRTIAIFQDYKNNINKTFFAYQLKIRFEIERIKARGTTIKTITKEEFANFIINVPPLSEQQSIVDYLDSAFAKIDAMKANAEKALNEAKALFQAFLKEILEPKEGWEEKKMSELYDVRDGTHDSPKYQETGYPLVTSKNLRGGILDMSNVNFISEEDYNAINNRSKVDIGDVLFAMIGTIGNPVYVQRVPNYAIKNMALFKVPSNQSGEFLRYYLLNDDVLCKMQNDSKGTTQKFVSLGYLRNFLVKIPSLSEQQSIVATLDSLKSKVDKLQENYDKISQECDALKQAILRQVFE